MVRRWIKYLGKEEAIRLMKWNNSDPTFSLRFLVTSFSLFSQIIKRNILATFSSANVRANNAKGTSRADLVTKLNSLEVPAF